MGFINNAKKRKFIKTMNAFKTCRRRHVQYNEHRQIMAENIL